MLSLHCDADRVPTLPAAIEVKGSSKLAICGGEVKEVKGVAESPSGHPWLYLANPDPLWRSVLSRVINLVLLMCLFRFSPGGMNNTMQSSSKQTICFQEEYSGTWKCQI